MPKIPRFRWLILSLVFLAAVLNYIDRQTLSALAPTIQRDLGMDDRDYANVLNIFLAAYTAAYLIAGRLVDALGARFGMGVFVVWWSLANMLTAWAQGMRTLSAFRFLLGLGEAGVWPAASKVVASWFPASERALAIGLYTTGATVGAILAPYLVIPLAGFSFPERVTSMVELLGWEHGVGWRIAFVLTGLAGVLWLGLWLKFYREPRDSAYIAEAELKLLSHGAGGQVADEAAWGWRKILKSRLVWLLLLGRLLTDPVWYFFQFWLPKYLHSERDLTQEQLKITWIVYAAAGLGSLVGGWSSGILVAKKISPHGGECG
ncbi:MAG: MFS transporter [Lacunisphaera sp.]